MRILIAIFSLSIGLQSTLWAQKKLPNIVVENLNAQELNTSDFYNDGKPIIISFWATWCKPCISELDAISDEYEDWQAETGVKLIAVSIDDERSSAMVKTMVIGRDWPFDIYLDKNQEFKRALNVLNVPHTFLLNGKGEIVWQHNSYIPGSEEELYERIKALNE